MRTHSRRVYSYSTWSRPAGTLAIYTNHIGGITMHAISITLSRGRTEEEWCLEINGSRYNHVSASTLDALVEQAVLKAQINLLENEGTHSNEINTDTCQNPQLSRLGMFGESYAQRAAFGRRGFYPQNGRGPASSCWTVILRAAGAR
jgi:hypothetical protein